VDKFDRELVVKRDRALQLQLNTAALRQGTEGLGSEIELVLRHQDEMHAALSELERQVEEEGRAYADEPGERQRAYALVEDLDRQLADTRALLTDSIGRLNARTAGGGPDTDGQQSGQLARMVRVLDVHLNAFQYLESNTLKLDHALETADKLLAQPRGGRLVNEPFGR